MKIMLNLPDLVDFKGSKNIDMKELSSALGLSNYKKAIPEDSTFDDLEAIQLVVMEDYIGFEPDKNEVNTYDNLPETISLKEARQRVGKLKFPQYDEAKENAINGIRKLIIEHLLEIKKADPDITAEFIEEILKAETKESIFIAAHELLTYRGVE